MDFPAQILDIWAAVKWLRGAGSKDNPAGKAIQKRLLESEVRARTGS